MTKEAKERVLAWRSKRYLKGVRAKNAGISLTQPEIELIDSECHWVTRKTGKVFTRTALVRYVLEEYFGEEWRKVLVEKLEGVPSKREKLVTAAESSSNGTPETLPSPSQLHEDPEIGEQGPIESHGIYHNDPGIDPVPSEPEPASSEAT